MTCPDVSQATSVAVHRVLHLVEPTKLGALAKTQRDTTLVRDDGGAPQYFYVQMQDITGHRRLELDLAHNALHDTLTGLPNRALLVDRLVHGLAGMAERALEQADAVLRTVDFNHDSLDAGLRASAQQLNIKAGQMFQPIRVAVCGRKTAPPLFETLEVLGRPTSLQRIDQAIQMLS